MPSQRYTPPEKVLFLLAGIVVVGATQVEFAELIDNKVVVELAIGVARYTVTITENTNEPQREPV